MGQRQKGTTMSKQREALEIARDALENLLAAYDMQFRKYEEQECQSGAREAIKAIDETLAEQQGEPVAWPETPEQVRDFVAGNYNWKEADELNPSATDKYCLTAHDLLSAFDCWRDTHPAPAPSQQNIKQELAECFDALAKCRDAFPAPLPNSTGDQEWKAAMADPLEVPEFVRVMVASNQAGPSWQELSREEAFALAHRRCTRYHHDALTPMYTFTGHHLMDFLRDIREKNAKGHV
jgi:hypothetical protein